MSESEHGWPTADQVREILAGLISGTVTREDAARWASQFLFCPRQPADWPVIKAVEAIGGADLTSTDRPFLYGPDHFAEWLNEFNAEVG